MTRRDEVAKALRETNVLVPHKGMDEAASQWFARVLDDKGHLLPGLPEPTNSDPDYAPVWQYGLIEAEGNPDGSVLIDTENYQRPLLLNRLQVLMILAASESRGARQ